MSATGVGLAFASLVLVRELWRWYAPRKRRRAEARAACESWGHRWGDTHLTAFGSFRECGRCGMQQYWSEARKQWL